MNVNRNPMQTIGLFFGMITLILIYNTAVCQAVKYVGVKIASKWTPTVVVAGPTGTRADGTQVFGNVTCTTDGSGLFSVGDCDVSCVESGQSASGAQCLACVVSYSKSWSVPLVGEIISTAKRKCVKLCADGSDTGGGDCNDSD